MKLRELGTSKLPWVAVVYGVGGVTWIAASLLLARELSTEQFAHVALFLALTQVAGPIGPLGADGLARRQRLAVTPQLLWRLALSSMGVGVLASFFGSELYDLTGPILLVVPGTALAVGICTVASAELQGRGRFGPSLVILQGQSVAILAAGVAAFLGVSEAWQVCSVYGIGCALLGLWGWSLILVDRRVDETSVPTFPWREAGSLLLIHGAGLLMVQLERLVTPVSVSLQALAVYGVLASTAGAPFRMLHLAVSFVLVPRLREAQGPPQRWRILKQEMLIVSIVSVLAGIGVLICVPFVVREFLQGKYELSYSLILAAIVVGIWKGGTIFVTSSVYALGTQAQLARLGIYTWMAVVIGVLLGIVGGRWGLQGVVYGVGLGWASLGLIAARQALLCLRSQPAE